jgi:hypothetical protein
MMKDHRTLEQDEIRKLLVKKQQKTKPKGVRNNSSKKAIKERIQQDKEEKIVKINESSDDEIILYSKISFRIRPVLLGICPTVNTTLIPLCHTQFPKEQNQANHMCAQEVHTYVRMKKYQKQCYYITYT